MRHWPGIFCTDSKIRKFQAFFCPGHANIEKTSLLFFRFFRKHGIMNTSIRDYAFVTARNPDSITFKPLRGMEGHKRNIPIFFTFQHLLKGLLLYLLQCLTVLPKRNQHPKGILTGNSKLFIFKITLIDVGIIFYDLSNIC